MVSTTRLEVVGGQAIPVRIRKTIQSIREIVGNHSDADIYAVLKETNMDPNETAQKLLNQDPFHEVKRKRDKRKEFTGYKLTVDPRKHTQSIHWEKSNKSMHLNAHRGGLARSDVPEARNNKEFRVVRDNRVNQTLNKDAKFDSLQHILGIEHVNSNISEKRSTRNINEQKLLNSSILDGHGTSQNLNASCSHGLDHDLSRASRSTTLPPKEIMTIPRSTNSEPERAVVNSSAINFSSNNNVIGVYSSSSDPVHVPSPASRSVGSVGAIRREVGAVGLKKQSSNVQPTKSAVSNNSHYVNSSGKVILSSTESLRGSTTNIKIIQLNQVPISDNIIPTTSNRRSAQNNSKHLQTFKHQRAMQPNMEWKPKNQKLKNDSSSTAEPFSDRASSSDNAFNSNLVNAVDLSDKLSNANICGEQHVIIPQHLRVPEAECSKFTFGSFGDGFLCNPGFLSTQKSIGIAEQPEVTTSASKSAFVPVGPIEETSVEVGHLVDFQAVNSRSTSPASAEELEFLPSANSEPLNRQSIESYTDIRLVQSHSPPFNSQQSQRMHEVSSMPSFSPYDMETSYVTPSLQTNLNDNVHGQSLPSQPEILNLHSLNSNPLTPTLIAQQQQQQQTSAQIYPQLHISHYPNFLPYRHILSPVYVPPMALPSYSTGPAYAHPSTGNSYLLMPGGSSHLPAGGMKYAPSQYKPLPAGSSAAYGNYSNPAPFAIGTPSTIGGAATGLEDMMRIKYKDTNLYVPNQQAETSDMWIQTPRDLPSLQSVPYYNLSGHAAHPTAFVSAHAAAAADSGHGSFNAVAATAQPSPMQYPGMYHPTQAGSIAAPHHLVHQQVPPVGLAAGGPQVGAFQQSQLGRLNWTANF